MAAQLIAIYTNPEDAEAFDKHYAETHLPLAGTMPGLRKVDVYRHRQSFIGDDDVHVMAVLHFDDRAAAEAAAKSEEGMASGKDAYKLSGGTVRLFLAEPDEVAG